MCLVFVAFRTVPGYALVVAANRDEFHARATAPVQFWPDAPDLLAGRDLEAGGTWLGLTRAHRFAALTNVRGGGARTPGAPSRGELVSGFLRGTQAATTYLDGVRADGARYSGFNLLVFDGAALAYVSNRGAGPSRLAPGLYGLSNHLLDTPWPKVTVGKAAVGAVLAAHGPDPQALAAVMAMRCLPPPAYPPDTNGEAATEQVHAPIFIAAPHYGTRSTTVLAIPDDGPAWLVETAFDADGQRLDSRRFET